jgi:HEAT repeat protein
MKASREELVMLQVNISRRKYAVFEVMNTFTTLPIAIESEPDQALDALLADLSPSVPWGDRKIAAEKLGNARISESVPQLLAVLPTDPFWMVRCAIIQALEKIGDLRAIPTLHEVASQDSFQVVRSYANRAIERLSTRMETNRSGSE